MLVFIIQLSITLDLNNCYAQSTQKPNIIVIIPDDMGWSDVGYNGSAIETPNIDQLEQSGVRLNQQYVMTTCTPTRVGLFTGQYASRFGVTGPDYGEVIPEGTPTMASLLDKKGYFTALVGKWHMGSLPHIPIRYGFQSAYGYLDGQIDPYTHNYKKQADYTSRKSWNGEGEYFHQKGHDTGTQPKELQIPEFTYLNEKGHATDLLTDQAIHIIKQKNKKPFFLYLAYSVPHPPLNEPQKWLDRYKNTFTYDSRRRFAASVAHMDAGIGRIIDTLDKTGQRSNTLILFISDNGGGKNWTQKYRKKQYFGRYANTPHNVLGNNFPLRGWKNTLYEGGIRVPAFINWPGHLQPQSLETPIKWTDWVPTFLGLTGSDPKLIRRLDFDGKNIWSVLKGTESRKKFKTRTIFWESPRAYAVRKGPWKLLVHRKTGKTELYNIKDDFRELHEMSGKYPQKLKQLTRLVGKFKK